MTGRRIDLSTWSGASQFNLFRTFEKPHYVITTRVDATRLQALPGSAFRSALWAIGSGIAAVDALRTRFDGDTVTLYYQVQISPPIALDDETFSFGYFDWQPDRAAFDKHAEAEIHRVLTEGSLASAGKPWVCYASCLPWFDFTGLDNAIPSRDDCIPRISWGKIVPKGDGYDMALAIQVHHALVDGRQIARFFEATEDALASLSQ